MSMYLQAFEDQDTQLLQYEVHVVASHHSYSVPLFAFHHMDVVFWRIPYSF